MASNTAIFYDIENLMGIFSGKTKTGLHLEEIYRRVLEVDGVTGVSIQRAYADWAVPMHRNLRNSVLQVGIEPMQIFNTNQNDRVKNAADVSLIIDAVDLAASRPEIQNFVIASGDGIFAFLSKKLHERGKRVIGCSFEKVVNNIFRNSCDYFIGLEMADKAIIATPFNKTATTPATGTVAPQLKEPKKRTNNKVHLPRTKYTDILLEKNIEPPDDTGDTSSVMLMVCKMVETLFTSETSDMPGLEISIFANYINYLIPNFKVKSFGFRGIGEFTRFVLTGSEYCTYSVSDNVVLMGSRAMAEAAEGKIVGDVKGLLIATQDGERYNSVFNVPEGTPFVYSVQKEEKRKPARAAKPIRKEPVVDASHDTPEVQDTPIFEASPTDEMTTSLVDSQSDATQPAENTLRRMIKAQFDDLSRADSLPASVVRKLTTEKYSQETFGVRTPILVKITEKSDIAALRRVNNKVRYWKEIYHFQGQDYLVFKEWTGVHRARFVKWANKYRPK